jgi:hypothetical protein
MKASTLDTNPVQALSVGRSGELRPMYGGRGISDMRTVSSEFLLSLQSFWRQRGDEILHRVADHYPELIFSGMIKLAKVTRIEVGSPGDFAKLGKADIVQKLEPGDEGQSQRPRPFRHRHAHGGRQGSAV